MWYFFVCQLYFVGICSCDKVYNDIYFDVSEE